MRKNHCIKPLCVNCLNVATTAEAAVTVAPTIDGKWTKP